MVFCHHLLDNIQIDILSGLWSLLAMRPATSPLPGCVSRILRCASATKKGVTSLCYYDLMHDALYVLLDKKHDFFNEHWEIIMTQVLRAVILLYSHNLYILLYQRQCFRLMLL